jgi:LPS sulfotransferase NodH
MFFGPRKRRTSAGGVSHPSGTAPNQLAELESVQWRAWRCAAQKATRAWNEWLASDGHERYLCYVSALAEEEQAAVAIERTVRREATARDVLERASGT